jgi:hypothetical protein
MQAFAYGFQWPFAQQESIHHDVQSLYNISRKFRKGIARLQIWSNFISDNLCFHDLALTK